MHRERVRLVGRCGRRCGSRPPAAAARRQAGRGEPGRPRAPSPPGQARSDGRGTAPTLRGRSCANPGAAGPATARLTLPCPTPCRPPLTIAEVQRRVDAELDRIAPVIDDARAPLRRGRPRAGAGRRAGARRDARAAAQRPRLHHLGAPRARPSGCSTGWARRDVGHGPRLRHHRLPQGRLAGRDHDVPLRDLRPLLAQARRRLRRLPRRRPGPPRLHRQRDGGPAAGPRVRGPVRRRRRPRPPGAAHARAARRTPSPTTRCG